MSKAKAKGSLTPEARGRKSGIPLSVEHDVAHTVRAVRSLNLPVFRADIFMWVHVACEGIEGITMPVNMNKRYPSFLRRNSLSTKNLRPLDVAREAWY